MDITSLITDELKNNAINAITKKTGLDAGNTKDIVSKALPMILGQLKKNSKDSNKSKSLENAVKNNNGDVLDNLDNIDLKDGSKILGHIFGDKKEEIEKKVGDKDTLSATASLVMGLLGKANSKSKDSASSLLSNDGIIGKLAISFLDKNGDGNIKDDLFTMIINFIKGLLKGKK